MSSKSQEIVFLQGKRINLRPLLREDIPMLLRWINDPEISRFLTAYLPVMEAAEEGWLDELSKNRNTDIVFAIVTKKGKIIGTMGIHRIQWKDRVATTGALIGDKRYQDKGYGTEAKMILLNYAFNTLNLRKICSEVIDFNQRSQAYLKKCGYKEEGRKVRHLYQDGRYRDLIQVAVFKRRWTSLWKAYKKKYLS